MTIRDIISGWNKAPIIFAGPGLPARYLGMPGREGLAEHFAREIKDDPKVLSEYYNRARVPGKSLDLLPIAAGLIEQDYNALWQQDPSIRHTNTTAASPFRAELATYLNNFNIIMDEHRAEYELLKSLCWNGISGFITTNYDSFLESFAPNCKSIIGPEGILSEPVQGKGEIIHLLGSAEKSESILITQQDYNAFDKVKGDLIRRLLPVFLEYPVIFIGYSSRNNAYRIIDWIATGLDDDRMKAFENRFAIVSLSSAISEPCVEIIDDYVNMSDEAHFHVAEADLPDYSMLYNELKILS